MSSFEPSRIHLYLLNDRFGSIRMFGTLILVAASVLLFVTGINCGGGEDDVAPTATESVPPTEPPTSAPIPELTATPVVDAAPESAVEKSVDSVGTNGDISDEDALATVLGEWGSTCLNGVYPPHAPQLGDVSDSDLSTDPNGVQFVTISEGDGELANLNWEVDVQYTGWLDDGCIFDSSYTRSEPTVFPVNAVIPGWQMALTQMKVGERRRVVIPPDLAYGPAGSPPVIPGNATLTFDIILVGGTDPDAANALATQTADDLLLQATAEAREFDAEAAEFEPILVDYIQDVDSFIAAVPQGEVTCMTAYAGGIENVEQIFSSQVPPTLPMIANFDECLSDNTLRNIAAGRIAIISSEISDETLSCIEGRLENPTLRPLFGVFDEARVSEQWISSHFCLSAEERVAFEEALFANQPGQEPTGAGGTFIDVQECMVGELGAARYFEPVNQPDTGDREAMEVFFTNFTAFLIADIHCRQGEKSYELSDGTVMSEDAARCVADSLGDVRFGEVLLDRVWVPTIEEHVEAATAYGDCGVSTDFLALPEGVGTLESSELSCIAGELDNSDDPRQTTLRALSEVGARTDIKAGDLVALLLGTQTCGIDLPGIPDGANISDAAAMCISGKVDNSLYVQGRALVLDSFELALQDSAECFSGN